MIKDKYHRLIPDHIEKLYWTAGEIARELKVSVKTIHAWEKYFDVKVHRTVRRRTNHLTTRKIGDRIFNQAGRRKLHRIAALVGTGDYTLQGVKKELIKRFPND